jgi:NhaA family Na+:H+ antiporter
MDESLAQLPDEAADRYTRPFIQFLRVEAAAGGVLLFCAFVALLLSNSVWSAQYLSFWDKRATFQFGSLTVSGSLKQGINDGLMTLFFFIGALELKREMVLGELRDLRIAALSLAGAIGGMTVPASLFLAFEHSGTNTRGWGTVMATDTALMIGCLALLGSRVPQRLRLFLLSLAIFDDIGAIGVAMIGYGGHLNWIALGLSGLEIACVIGLLLIGIRSTLAYVVFGTIIWFTVAGSGIHPTLTGLILGLMTPARSWVSDDRLHAILNRVVAYPPGDHWSENPAARRDLLRAGIATREALSPVVRHELHLHPFVAFLILPLFALANAGLPLSMTKVDWPLVTSIIISFALGKPLGVMLFSYLSVKLHLAERPPELSWSVLLAGSLLTGIGFTMALFIAELAFSSVLLNSAKLGILIASFISAAGGLLALAGLTKVYKGIRHHKAERN